MQNKYIYYDGKINIYICICFFCQELQSDLNKNSFVFFRNFGLFLVCPNSKESYIYREVFI